MGINERGINESINETIDMKQEYENAKTLGE